MKLLGQCLVWLSLAAGAVSAATAYLVSLETLDERLVGLTFAAPAGRRALADGTHEPLAVKDQELTAELLADLRASSVRNIRVKQFAFDRWRGKWAFLLALAGLAAGGLLVKRAGKSRGNQPGGGAEAEGTPLQLLESLRKDLQSLRIELPKLPDDAARCGLVVQQVGRLQRSQIPAIVDRRNAIVSAHGLAAYATLMDSFAGAERQLNRAWSAAVDRVYAEAADCLENAWELLEETAGKLQDFQLDGTV